MDHDEDSQFVSVNTGQQFPISQNGVHTWHVALITCKVAIKFTNNLKKQNFSKGYSKKFTK